MSTNMSKTAKEEEEEEEPIEVYHVTNVSAAQEAPNWEEIKTSISNNDTYDEDLGLPVASFTSTRSDLTGGKPTSSMYLRNEK